MSQLHTGVYKSYSDSSAHELSQKAFSFKVARPLVLLSTDEEGKMLLVTIFTSINFNESNNL